MSKHAHTPGPWTIGRDCVESGWVDIEHGGDGMPIIASARNQAHWINQHNARLIAAAPQMLEALESIRVFAQDCIESGHDRGSLGNLYSIRDLCDRITEATV